MSTDLSLRFATIDAVRYPRKRGGSVPFAALKVPAGVGDTFRMQQDELNQVVEAHRARVYGFFRGRTRDDAVAQDLAQRTWLEVSRRMHTFDSQKGSFRTFVMIWAKLTLKRWIEEIGTNRLVPESAMATDAADDRDDLYGRTASESRDIEERITLSQAYLELVRYTASCPRLPHEVIGFGFSRLQYKPSELVAAASHLPLSLLEAQLEQEYAELAPLPALHAAFLPLRNRLSLALNELMRDRRTRELYEATVDLTRAAGATVLRDYCRADKKLENEVMRWCDSVKRTVMAEIRRTGSGILFEFIREGRTL